MEAKSKRDRLLEILTTKSFKRGRFVLASGKESDFYIDCRVTALDAEGAALVGEVMWQHLMDAGIGFDAVGGPTLGADPLVTATSITSYRAGQPVPGFIIRKQPKGHGLGQWVEGRSGLREGMRVVILEDVITTGSSSKAACERAEAEGLVPVYLLALVDRLEGARENLRDLGIPVASIFTRHDFIPPEDSSA